MKLASALLLAAIVASWSTSAEAISMVSAEATLDWTAFTFTTTGAFSVTSIRPIFGPSTFGGFTRTTPTTAAGSATASESVVNGFLTASAGAEATATGTANIGEAHAGVFYSFFLDGTGIGSVVVTVPYHLELTSVETDELDITSASANVSFLMRAGIAKSEFVHDNLSLTAAGTVSRDGVLTASVPVDPSTYPSIFGEPVLLLARSAARATATVPEADSALLLTLGLLAIGAVAYRRRNIQ